MTNLIHAHGYVNKNKAKKVLYLNKKVMNSKKLHSITTLIILVISVIGYISYLYPTTFLQFAIVCGYIFSASIVYMLIYFCVFIVNDHLEKEKEIKKIKQKHV